MVNLTIDGKKITVKKNATIYEAAAEAGIHIPVLCYAKKLLPYGACRVCLVEVEQMKGRLIPSCTTPVTEGMVVTTTSEEIHKVRKTVLEFLLVNHVVDCPVCDKGGECDLQDLTYEYEVVKNRFEGIKFDLPNRRGQPADRAQHEPLRAVRQMRPGLRRDRRLRFLLLHQPRLRDQDRHCLRPRPQLRVLRPVRLDVPGRCDPAPSLQVQGPSLAAQGDRLGLWLLRQRLHRDPRGQGQPGRNHPLQRQDRGQRRQPLHPRPIRLLLRQQRASACNNPCCARASNWSK